MSARLSRSLRVSCKVRRCLALSHDAPAASQQPSSRIHARGASAPPICRPSGSSRVPPAAESHAATPYRTSRKAISPARTPTGHGHDATSSRPLLLRRLISPSPCSAMVAPADRLRRSGATFPVLVILSGSNGTFRNLEAMTMTLPLKCRCGAVRGEMQPRRAYTRATCCCKDCRAYARFLGDPGVLDEAGGTDVVPTAPAT